MVFDANKMPNTVLSDVDVTINDEYRNRRSKPDGQTMRELVMGVIE